MTAPPLPVFVLRDDASVTLCTSWNQESKMRPLEENFAKTTSKLYADSRNLKTLSTHNRTWKQTMHGQLLAEKLAPIPLPSDATALTPHFSKSANPATPSRQSTLRSIRALFACNDV